LKYEKEEAADLMVKIMTVIISVQKCTEAWKEGKVVMLPKPFNEEDKDKPGNWKPITLTSILYIIYFGRYIWKNCRVFSTYSQEENI
jgi:hypothetical protein